MKSRNLRTASTPNTPIIQELKQQRRGYASTVETLTYQFQLDFLFGLSIFIRPKKDQQKKQSIWMK